MTFKEKWAVGKKKSNFFDLCPFYWQMVVVISKARFKFVWKLALVVDCEK